MSPLSGRIRSGRLSFLKTAGALAAGVGLYLALGFPVANSYYQMMLTLVPIWAVMGLSWNLLSGYTGYVSFGHAAFFGIGAYTVAVSFARFGLSPWLGIPLGMVAGGLAALLIGFPVFRLRGHYFGLAMLAFPLAFLHVAEWLGLQEVALPLKRDDAFAYLQFADPRGYVALASALLLAALLVSLAVERSRFGMALMAIKQNEAAAEASGIDTFRCKMLALVLSAVMGAAAGGVYAVVLLVITPNTVFGLLASAQALVIGLFGGAGSLWGPLIGAAFLIPFAEILHAELGHILPGIQGVVFGLAIIAVTLLAPEGVYWTLRDRWAARRLARAPVDPAPAGQPAAAVVIHPAFPAPVQPEMAAGAEASRTILSAPILSVRGLGKAFGGVRAVDDVSFDVPRGAVVGIIGPNGAGKTTLFNLLNGLVRPDGGEVRFDGRGIAGERPNAICRGGIGRTFQVARCFPRMSVLQNVMVGAVAFSRSLPEAEALAMDALRRVGLADAAQERAGGISNRHMRLMELARALAGQPRLLLLDETLAGLGREDVDEMVAVIQRLARQGITVVIIEHTMHAMVRLAEQFVVLDYGSVRAVGAPAEVMRDRQVIEAYLGKKWVAHAAR